MINNRTRAQATGRSHPGQLRRAARKKDLRREKRAADEQEAFGLGLTVDQLHWRRFEEAKPYMARPVVRIYVSPPTPVVSDDHRRYAETPRPGIRRRTMWD